MKMVIGGFERRGWKAEPLSGGKALLALSPDRATVAHVLRVPAPFHRFNYTVVVWSDYGRGETTVKEAGRVAAETVAMLGRLQDVASKGGAGEAGEDK